MRRNGADDARGSSAGGGDLPARPGERADLAGEPVNPSATIRITSRSELLVRTRRVLAALRRRGGIASSLRSSQ
jgi:hypothetical protein